MYHRQKYNAPKSKQKRAIGLANVNNRILYVYQCETRAQNQSSVFDSYSSTVYCILYSLTGQSIITIVMVDFGFHERGKKQGKNPFICLYLYNSYKYTCREPGHTQTFNSFRLFDQFLYVHFAIVFTEVFASICFYLHLCLLFYSFCRRAF